MFFGFWGYFVGFVVILVILRFGGILVIFEDFRVLWSFTLSGHFGNFDNWVGWSLPIIIGLGWFGFELEAILYAALVSMAPIWHFLMFI